jgi:hypothetical protein
MGITELWTIIAIVLKLAGVGSFAEWPIIASPLTWSCMCIEIWAIIFYLAVILLLGALLILKKVL